jgi:hypothetical protein
MRQLKRLSAEERRPMWRPRPPHGPTQCELQKYQMTHKNDGAGVASGARGADRATITRPSGMRHLAKGLLD